MDLARFRYYTEWHAHANERLYEVPDDPWRLLRVDPASVTHGNYELPLNWGLGWVRGEGWDADDHCEPLAETAVYRGLTQRFEDGRPWSETALYRRAKAAFEAGETVRGYDSLAEFARVRLGYLDDLYDSMSETGYRPNATAEHCPADPDNPLETAYAHRLDPLVLVGRTGDIYLTEGHHRVCLADILDVETVPVLVLCRHAEWQRTRDRLATGEVDTDDLPPGVDCSHPDLRDVTLDSR